MTSKNELVIAGQFKGTTDMDPFLKDSLGILRVRPRRFYIASTSGNLLWTGAFVGTTINGTTSSSWLSGLKLDGSNNILVTGGYSGRVDVDPSNKVTNLPIDPNYNQNAVYDDLFAVKLSPTGALLWARGWQSPVGTSFGRSQTDVDKFGNLYITGHLSANPGITWSVDLDPTAGVSQHLVTRNSSYVVRLNASGAFAWSRVIGITEDSDEIVGGSEINSFPWIAVGPNLEIYIPFEVYSAIADLDPSTNSEWVLASTSERIRRRGILRWNQG